MLKPKREQTREDPCRLVVKAEKSTKKQARQSYTAAIQRSTLPVQPAYATVPQMHISV